MKNKQPKPLHKTIQLRRRSQNIDPKLREVSQDNKENKPFNKHKPLQSETSLKKKQKQYPSLTINPSIRPLAASLILHHSTNITPAHKSVTENKTKMKEDIIKKIEYWSRKIHVKEAKFQIDALVTKSKNLFGFNEEGYQLLCSLKALAFVAIDFAKNIDNYQEDSQDQEDTYILKPQQDSQMMWLKPSLKEKLKLNLTQLNVFRKKQMIK